MIIDGIEYVERFVRYYGDGAVLTCSRSLFDLCTPWDGEAEEVDPTCDVRVVMPRDAYARIWHYCHRDNNGPDPIDDGYEAANLIASTMIESEVVYCDVTDEAGEHVSPCFLCGC